MLKHTLYYYNNNCLVYANWISHFYYVKVEAIISHSVYWLIDNHSCLSCMHSGCVKSCVTWLWFSFKLILISHH